MSGDGGLFESIVTTDELMSATCDQAWLQAMLDVEAALAAAEAEAGIIPGQAASDIAACCQADRFDAAELGRSARLGGNPAIPVVAALIAAVGEEAGDWVHWGATSQDIIDSGAMLVTVRALTLIDGDLVALADACATLAAEHRDTLMAGRTLLQHALPITFGLKAAGWLAAVVENRRQLAFVRQRLAVQFGGAVGTLAALGDRGPAVAAGLARRLGLAEPPLPWHTARQRVAETAAMLGMVAGTAAKIATDVALLMQTEVAEVSEPAMPGRGGSSTLPHKRNPVGAAAVNAAARRAHALLPVIFSAMVAEHERALGGWQAEWQTLTELLRLAGGAAAHVRETLAGLEVHSDQMLANLECTGGLMLAERVSFALAGPLGRPEAIRLVGDAARRAVASGRAFQAELLDVPAIAAALSADDLASLLHPAGYLGASSTFIDRALRAHRDQGTEQ